MDARIQHIVVDGAVAGADEGPRTKEAQHPHHGPQQKAQQDQLAGAGVGPFLLPGAEVLAHHHRAAGGQRRKQHDDQIVEHIHQTYARDGRLAAAGDHHGIGHTHRHLQQLLNEQRPGQPEQVFLTEQRGSPAKQRLAGAALYF